MNERWRWSLGVSPRIGAAILLLNVGGCATEQTAFEVRRSTEVDINVEDVEQIPIQEVSARERAARQAERCGGSGRSRAGCDQDGGVDVDAIFGAGEP